MLNIIKEALATPGVEQAPSYSLRFPDLYSVRSGHPLYALLKEQECLAILFPRLRLYTSD